MILYLMNIKKKITSKMKYKKPKPIKILRAHPPGTANFAPPVLQTGEKDKNTKGKPE